MISFLLNQGTGIGRTRNFVINLHENNKILNPETYYQYLSSKTQFIVNLYKSVISGYPD